MSAALESFVSILFVEPRIASQLELLHVAQDVRAPLALSCVATCGGARDALAGNRYDFLLLSTNLCYETGEHRELAALVEVARVRGIVVMSFGAGELYGLGLRGLDSLTSLYGRARDLRGAVDRLERERA